MDRQQLRERQSPIKDDYRAEPQAAQITLRAKGTLDGDLDFRGTLGIDKDVPVVYQTLVGGVTVDVSSSVTT